MRTSREAQSRMILSLEIYGIKYVIFNLHLLHHQLFPVKTMISIVILNPLVHSSASPVSRLSQFVPLGARAASLVCLNMLW